jgi:Secretion system C-terminal sorting domain
MTKAYTMKQKHAYILGVFLFILRTYTTSAQVYYYYDNNGNRITSTYTHHAPERRNNDNNVKMYPNPTVGEVNVAISSFGNCSYASIYIVDGSGNVLSTQNTSSLMNTVNLSGYNQGMYYLRTVMCDQQYTFKIVKVNPGAPAATKPAPVKY